MLIDSVRLVSGVGYVAKIPCSVGPNNSINSKNNFKHVGMQMNSLPRWMKATLSVMLLALLFGGGWFYRLQEQTLRRQKETDLSAVVRLKAQQIKVWREDRLGDAAVLQENPLFVKAVARFQADPRDENTMDIRALFYSLSKRHSYADVLLVDPDGRVRLSLSGKTEVHSGYATALAAALRDRKPEFADLHTEAQNPTPRISVIAPLFTGDEQASKPVGAVILVCDASQFLYPAVQSWPTFTKTSETLLVRREGDDVLFLNDLRHKPGTALKLRIPLSRTDVPAVMAVLGQEGVVTGKDYRGVEVLSVILPVPDSPWFMVGKIDATEAFAEGRFRSVLILGLFIGMVGMMVLLGLVVRQREQKKHYRELYRSESSLRAIVERHSITLKAIGDAVIATDARGRVELLNPVAERLTGWSVEEARGRPLEEVFRIVNEKTRAEVENPVARVLREGVVVGLANHTLLIAKDGVERPIADSGAPMRADDGTIIGVVLVFRDQSVEWMSQRLTQVRLDLIAYAAAHTLDELVTKTLDEIGSFLDSPIGFYHFLESDQKTLSLRQWSTRTLEFCRAEGTGLHYSIDQAGVWVDCVKERKPVIHNDYFSLEHKKGMPEGHAEVVRELVAPVMREGKIVAIVGVGNKPVDYTEKDAETVSYLADVTWEILERRRAEEALLASEEKFRLAFMTSPDAINLNRVYDGMYLDSNDGFAKIMGYAREDVIGKNSLELNIWDDPKDRERLVATLERQGVVENMEAGFRGKDGRIRIGLMSACVYRINQEDVILSITRDITELKRAETALRESEELYRTLVSLSPDAISVVDMNGSLIFASPKGTQMFGDAPDGEFLGRSIFSWVAPEDHKKASANIQRLIREGTLAGAEYTLIKNDGTRFIGEVNAAVIHSPDGSPMSMIVITRDVTERKQEQEEKEKLEAQLFQAQKMESVGRLAGGVAHDFNNMLGVIIGRAEMALNEGVSTDELHNNLKEILNAGLRSADLTRQLLAFARKQTAVPKILDMNDTISGMLKMLRRLIGEDIDLFWAPELDLWKVKIDPSQVDQILANLVVNARDAISGVGAITMRTENIVIDDSVRAETPEFIPGKYVLLTVSDNGTGMSKEVRENIFEPFFTTKELGKGTGLGLSTVYGIVKQNDGFIYVVSEPGKGTTFKIYMPRFEVETAQAATEEVAGMPPTGIETILMVEDDEPILNLGKMMLERLGYTVLAAQTPVQAINLVAEHPGEIHLLITDIVMPGMNGRELAKQLGAVRPKLKCLYMSGYTADLIAHRGILDEGLNFIQKPFCSDDFAEKVRQVLDHLE
jgi:two-component system, cell cycle sensor histidine kinase and response regulator CckA